jgi:Na+-driven multidrug efflux pump
MVNLMEAAYLAIGFVVFVVTVSIGGAVLTGVQSVAANATGAGLTGIANLAGQSGTIGTILGAVIILGLLMGAFAIGNRQ